MEAQVAPYAFTVEEFHRMVEAGVFGEDDRVELIEGSIMLLLPIDSRHAGCVNRLVALLTRRAGSEAVVSVQNPVRLDAHSEPQPAVALLRPRDDFYAEAHPVPADVLLLVEVADATLHYDRTVKVPAYARAGIPEVWLVDLENRQISVYRTPAPEGYRDVRHARTGDTLDVQLLPGVRLDAGAVLG